MTKKVVWYASGDDIRECGPFDSQVKAWDAMRYTYPAHPARIHPADTHVWPVEVAVPDKKPKVALQDVKPAEKMSAEVNEVRQVLVGIQNDCHTHSIQWRQIRALLVMLENVVGFVRKEDTE